MYSVFFQNLYQINFFPLLLNSISIIMIKVHSLVLIMELLLPGSVPLTDNRRSIERSGASIDDFLAVALSACFILPQKQLQIYPPSTLE